MALSQMAHKWLIIDFVIIFQFLSICILKFKQEVVRLYIRLYTNLCKHTNLELDVYHSQVEISSCRES